jgi:Domain of unknown function (DUF5666)
LGSVLHDGSVVATQIQVTDGPGMVRRVDFRGKVETLPSGGLTGDWSVCGRTVHVTADTKIKRKKGLVVSVNSFVDVKGVLTSDASLAATSIKVKF